MSFAEICAAITSYCNGGSREGFGRRLPYKKACGGGGLDTLVTTVLAVSPGLELDDCPDDDTEYSALLFGRLVGQSSIEASDLTIVKMAMEVAYAQEA